MTTAKIAMMQRSSGTVGGIVEQTCNNEQAEAEIRARRHFKARNNEPAEAEIQARRIFKDRYGDAIAGRWRPMRLCSAEGRRAPQWLMLTNVVQLHAHVA